MFTSTRIASAIAARPAPRPANSVLDNDTDAESNPLNAVLVSGPSNASSFMQWSKIRIMRGYFDRSTAKRTATTTAPATQATPVIGVTIYKYDDTFMSGVRNAISKAAEGKAQVDFADSGNQQPVQSVRP